MSTEARPHWSTKQRAAGSDVAPNAHGVVAKTILRTRCAVARHQGSRENITTATFLVEVWLPASGEQLGDFPIFFHFVNVGPDINDKDMITDVYLPLTHPGEMLLEEFLKPLSR